MALGKARALIGRPWVWVVVGLLALFYYVLEVQGYRSLFYIPGDRFRAAMNQFDKPDPGDTIERSYGDARRLSGLKKEFDSKRKARYGFTWRGIKRPHDREMGIAGGELIALDLDTNEVLAVRRGYAHYAGQLQLTPVCPKYGYEGGWDKFGHFTYWFVGKV